MRRYFMLVAVGTAAVLSVVGCGSDSDGGTANNGGGAGASSLTQCLGNNAEFTPDEFVAGTEDGKGCSDLTDMQTVCANDMPLIVGTCGKNCLNMADEAMCVAACVQQKVTHDSYGPLSNGCLTCYGEDVVCARDNCLVACGLNPTSAGCATCRLEKGCADAFYECSGLPRPTGS